MPELVSSLGALALWALFGYLAGSVPFGVISARIFGLGDLRQVGSGNIGATNVLRTGSKAAALMTLLGDGGKGALAVLVARAFGAEDAAQIAGLAAFIGHCWPIWLGFRGGKGVATYLGLMLALAWPVGIAACVTWLAVAALARISSLAALMAALSGPIWAFVLGREQLIILALLLAALVLWRHRANITRLRAGTEPRIGAK